MAELKPYELVQTYREARHSRINSWLFSSMAALSTVIGIGAIVSDLPYRLQIAATSFIAGLALVNRGENAGRTANQYQRRVIALEQASEDATIHTLIKSVQPSLPGIEITPTTPAPSLYNWADLVHEAVGVIIAGNSGSGKSSVATWIAGLLTQATPAQCLVLDPHWNDVWHQNGLTAIGHIANIEEMMSVLLGELDDRCRRKGEGKPLGEPLLIIADEIGACLERFKNPKRIESALRRLGSEGRKFGMTLIAINQSQNVEDLGISGQLRNNYVLVLLGSAARSRAKQLGAEFSDRLKGTAYPCIVSGACEDAIAPHPTHGHYPQFKKVGNPPANLIPIRQLPLTFVQNHCTLEEFEKAVPNSQRERLEQLIKQDAESVPIAEQLTIAPDRSLPFEISDLLPELQPIAKFSSRQGGWVKAIDCKRGIRALKSVSTEAIREYFLILEGQGCGSTRGTGETLEYNAFGDDL